MLRQLEPSSLRLIVVDAYEKAEALIITQEVRDHAAMACQQTLRRSQAAHELEGSATVGMLAAEATCLA